MCHRILVALVVATTVACTPQAKLPIPQHEPEEKATTDPPSAPLEAKLVVK